MSKSKISTFQFFSMLFLTRLLTTFTYIPSYTKALLSAIPLPVVGKEKKERKLITGEVTSPVNLPDICRFLSRCDECKESCRAKCNPKLVEVSPGHFVACHLADKE